MFKRERKKIYGKYLQFEVYRNHFHFPIWNARNMHIYVERDMY